MKIAFTERADGQKIVKRTYDKEVEAYSELKGRKCCNLPHIYSAEFDGEHFVVEEEFIDGISLQYMLDCGERFDTERACEIGTEVCNALAFLHEMGFVHRDVKPEHVIFTQEGRIVLIDLDASMRISSDKKRDTQLLGTTGYAAPEQFGLTRSDRRTDVFALGIMLNEMLTGEHPSVTLCRESPINEIIEKCIRINPQDRYRTIEELSEALEAVHSQIEESKKIICQSLRKDSTKYTTDIEVQKKRRTLTALGLAAVLLLSVGIFIGTTKAADKGIDSADNITDAESAENEESSDTYETVGTNAETEFDPIASGEYIQLYKDIYRDGATTYYTPNGGSQSAPLYTNEGELVDQSFNVYADYDIGWITGWSSRYNGWKLESTGCMAGAEGYIHAEKDGKHYAIKVVILGEEMSVYSCLPDIENIKNGYLKPQMGEKKGEPWSITRTYKKNEPSTLYLAFTDGAFDTSVWCDCEFVKIKPYEGTVHWFCRVYELTFYNPKGGYVSFDVSSEYNTQVFRFYEESEG